MNRILNNALCCLALYPCLAFADPLVTDRPDATESSSVVEPGYIQAELGWLYSESGPEEAHELPQTLLRIGLVDRVELRLGWAGYRASDTPGASEGAGDGELGTKIYLFEEQGLLPETALLASVSLPWGGSEVTSDEIDPAFRFSCSHTLSDRFSLGYNLGAEWGTENGSMLGSFIYTVALGAGLTEALGAYVEFFGDIGLSAPDSAHLFDGGLTYLVRDNLQLDVLGGVGLSDEAEDWFAGAGVSYRFPN